MSSRCNNSSGEFEQKQDSSEALETVQLTHVKTKNHSSSIISEYKTRLRPRPTKQTDHYQSFPSHHLSADLTRQKYTPGIKPPSSGIKEQNTVESQHFQSTSAEAQNRRINFCVSRKRSGTSDIFKPDSKLKLTKNVPSAYKTFSDLTTTSHQQNLPCSSRKGSKQGSTNKQSPNLLKKRRNPEVSKSSNFSHPIKTQKRDTFLGRKFNIKTGSCASSRKGSERSKTSSSATGARSLATCDKDIDSSNPSDHTTMQSSSRSKMGGDNQNDLEGKTNSNSDKAAASGSSAGSSSNNESETEESEMTRLQTLLEARGIPPHFFGNLGPRMQQILHRSIGSGSNSKAQQYLQGVQAVGDESRQLQSVIEMCQLLVMGNEDTLAGFPIKHTVPALINLLKMEHNFDVMNHACRALTYMMEALPCSSAFVVEAIPTFLEKLQVIQCMDVAEQSLTALDMLSKRHASAILCAGGQSSCLLYIDFFSLPAQRSALSVVANCCNAIGTVPSSSLSMEEEFNRLVKSSLPLLCGRLTHHDKKCVESTCLCFVRLVNNYQPNSNILSEIAKNDFLDKIQQLLVMNPPLLSSNIFVMVIRTMTIMCSCVNTLASALIKNGIAETLKYLMTGSTYENENGQINLLLRSPQELLEITSLIKELLPDLPKSNSLFSINNILWKDESASHVNEHYHQTENAFWQWKDNSGEWKPYNRHDSRIIEAAHFHGDSEATLTIVNQIYTIDMRRMQQINDDTGTARSVLRVASKLPKGNAKTSKYSPTIQKSELVVQDTKNLSEFIKMLFPILYEVYSSSAGSPSVRYCCLCAIQRMVYFAKPTLLSDMLQNLSVSSHISSMLCSPDIKVVAGALQLAEMLIQKLPRIFSELFHREGVIHQVMNLTEPCKLNVTDNATSIVIQKSQNERPPENVTRSMDKLPQSEIPSFPKKNFQMSQSKQIEASSSAFHGKIGSNSGGAKKKVSTRATRSSTSSILSNLNPVKWGRSQRSSDTNKNTSSSKKFFQSQLSNDNNTLSTTNCKRNSRTQNVRKSSTKDNDIGTVEMWVRNQAKAFLTDHSMKTSHITKTSILEQLTSIASRLNSFSTNSTQETLVDMSTVVNSVNVSSFEIQHSGLIQALLNFLTSENSTNISTSSSEEKLQSMISDTEDCRYQRIRSFLHALAGLPASKVVERDKPITQISANQVTSLVNLVRKLNQCVSQLEQYPVKCHDLLSGGSQVIKILSSNQLKCQLQRHPDCCDIKQWIGGPVKVDPLVQVKAIERYLLARGYGAHSSNSSESLGELSSSHDQDDSENEIEVGKDDLSNTDSNSGPESLLSELESTTSSTSTAFQYMAGRQDHKESNSVNKLDFYIGGQKIPHHITVFQAVRKYGWKQLSNSLVEESDILLNASENAAFWNKTHVIEYKLRKNDQGGKISNKGCGNKSKLSKISKVSSKQGKNAPANTQLNDFNWNSGESSSPSSPLNKYLVANPPSDFTTSDPSTKVLCLLRVIHAISRYWHFLYSCNAVFTKKSLVPASEFINSKINTKCTRQLKDPLNTITGQLVNWIKEIAITCPFVLTFETRQLLFKVTAFDRERAMQHLLDIGAAQEFTTAMSNVSNSGESHSHRGTNRFLPRLDKKKCSVSRNNILHEAEKIIFDHGHSSNVIEVDYENEVGTGLGPTLEFFTLASKEIQKRNLGLWRDLTVYTDLTMPSENVADKKLIKDNPKSVKKDKCLDCTVVSCKSLGTDIDEPSNSAEDKTIGVDSMENDNVYVKSLTGLFPNPIGKNAKLSQVIKIKRKFRFIGKFLAKALMDSRMVDLPMSICCYKWILGEERSLCGLDLECIDPDVTNTINKLKRVAYAAEMTQLENGNIETITMDGCLIEDLGLDMLLPGYSNVELMKFGRNTPVTIHNLDKYLKLIAHWTLIEGTKQQFESMREGFASIIPLDSLNIFFPEEMDQLFCGTRYEPWDIQELSEVCHPDHGYTRDSTTVKNLYRILSTYNPEQQRNFLQFVTGCPHLPVGGLKALNPKLTIVRKTCDNAKNVDIYLPSVMTCLNYLKIPDYSSETIMRQKLELAVAEGQKSFLLS